MQQRCINLSVNRNKKRFVSARIVASSYGVHQKKPETLLRLFLVLYDRNNIAIVFIMVKLFRSQPRCRLIAFVVRARIVRGDWRRRIRELYMRSINSANETFDFFRTVYPTAGSRAKLDFTAGRFNSNHLRRLWCAVAVVRLLTRSNKEFIRECFVGRRIRYVWLRQTQCKRKHINYLHTDIRGKRCAGDLFSFCFTFCRKRYSTYYGRWILEIIVVYTSNGVRDKFCYHGRRFWNV